MITARYLYCPLSDISSKNGGALYYFFGITANISALASIVTTEMTKNVKAYPCPSISAPTTEVEIAPTMLPNIVTIPNPIAFKPEGRLLVVEE